MIRLLVFGSWFYLFGCGFEAGGLTCRPGNCIVSGMKLTFTLPDRLARRFQAVYPPAKQSRVVAGLLARKLRVEDEEMAKSCRGANRLKEVAADMQDWEQLNVCDS